MRDFSKTRKHNEEKYIFQGLSFQEKLQAIPDKMAFKIGEVADLLNVKQYVLRYWETEFEELRPKKSSHNQRMYSKKNVEIALLIQKLLHEDRFSIEGARKVIRDQKNEMQRQKEMGKLLLGVSCTRNQLKELLLEIQAIKERIL